MNIRNYTNNDSEIIKSFLIENLKYHAVIDTLGIREYNVGDENDDFFKFIEKINNLEGIGLIAEESDVIVGFGFAYLIYDEKRINCKGRISKIYIEEQYRGKGYGKSMLSQLEKFLIDNGCKTITLSVYAPNTNAHEMYLKNDYKDRFIEMMKTVN